MDLYVPGEKDALRNAVVKKLASEVGLFRSCVHRDLNGG